MDTLKIETFTLPAPDGAQTFVRRWAPESSAKAVTVIAHGVSEHGGRYDRFAQALAARGYATYASDHRGHGSTGAVLGHAGAGGWRGTLADLHRVLERAKSEYPGVPAFFIGHSMGSILGQRFIAEYGRELAGAVLIGVVTSFAERADVLELATATLSPENAAEPSLVFAGLFANLNEPFEPKVNGFEWLSRDPDEVRKYVEDPLSGNLLTNETVADFFPGWMEAGSEETYALVPVALPVLIVAGSEDSAGDNGSAPKIMAEKYKSLGMNDVTAAIYQGARHEVLNETNRDEVQRDIIAWLDEHGAHPAS